MGQFDVEAECGACGARFKVPRIRRGSTEPCPVCGFEVNVPGGEAYQENAPSPVEAPSEPAAGHEAAGRGVSPAVEAAVESGLCFVCTEDDARFDFTKVSPIVDELDGKATLESRVHIAQGRGVLARRLQRHTAEAMVARLRAVQVPAFAVDEGLVPAVQRQLRVVRVHGVDEQALSLDAGPEDGIQMLPVRSLAAAFCTQADVVQGGPTELRPIGGRIIGLTRGGVMRTSKRYEAAPRPTSPQMMFTLLLRGQSGSLYRVHRSEKQVRYAYLGARHTPGLSQNFRLFLGDLMRLAPQAFFPWSTREVAAGRRIRCARLKGEIDYSHYLQWVLCHLAEG